eukprot:TRINITY_DN46854_c0_g1_i1.p1 TRINITY_DN46854_c0_g1~~TRINITY_DN46854_c0_g1_i1.p1  ORF type:complete len:104 (-),score=17.23 TRINITY_DN46854_c0_g1_i1:23-334(-)
MMMMREGCRDIGFNLRRQRQMCIRDRTYNIVVTAQDGTTTLTYTFTAGKDFSAPFVALAFILCGSLVLRAMLSLGWIRRWAAKLLAQSGWMGSSMQDEVRRAK